MLKNNDVVEVFWGPRDRPIRAGRVAQMRDVFVKIADGYPDPKPETVQKCRVIHVPYHGTPTVEPIADARPTEAALKQQADFQRCLEAGRRIAAGDPSDLFFHRNDGRAWHQIPLYEYVLKKEEDGSLTLFYRGAGSSRERRVGPIGNAEELWVRYLRVRSQVNIYDSGLAERFGVSGRLVRREIRRERGTGPGKKMVLPEIVPHRAKVRTGDDDGYMGYSDDGPMREQVPGAWKTIQVTDGPTGIVVCEEREFEPDP